MLLKHLGGDAPVDRTDKKKRKYWRLSQPLSTFFRALSEVLLLLLFASSRGERFASLAHNVHSD